MKIISDELAGITRLFGGLTRAELHDACNELGYKQTGERPDDDIVDDAIDAAMDAYCLVLHEEHDYLIPGPTAFPTLPTYAEDLHHILDIDMRDVDRHQPAMRLLDELESELVGEVDADRQAQIAQLSYDLEAWANVSANSLRSHVDTTEQPET